MPGTLITDDGTEISIDDLELGTQVELDDGNTYVVVEDDEGNIEAESGDGYADFDDDGDGEYGKSADFTPADYSQVVSKAYSEAITDEQRAEVLSEVAKAAAEADLRAAQSELVISKMQQDAYVDECISKAAEYGVAGPRTELLGVTLAKAMTVLNEEEIQLLDDILKSYSELAYEVAVGTETDGMSEVLDVVHGAADQIVKSSGGSVTEEQAMVMAFEQNPELYSMYLSEKEL